MVVTGLTTLQRSMWEGKMGRGGKEESMFSRSEDMCMGERMK